MKCDRGFTEFVSISFELSLITSMDFKIPHEKKLAFNNKNRVQIENSHR